MHTVKAAMDEQKGKPLLTGSVSEADFSTEINCEELSQSDQRSLIFHILYAIDAYEYDISLDVLIDNFHRGFGIVIPKNSDVYAHAASIIQERKNLDEIIIPLIDNWRFERLGVSTKLILRQSLWECIHTQTDHAVIINEAVELAKCFAEKDAYKFINGLLDEYLKRTSLKLSTP